MKFKKFVSNKFTVTLQSLKRALVKVGLRSSSQLETAKARRSHLISPSCSSHVPYERVPCCRHAWSTGGDFIVQPTNSSSSKDEIMKRKLLIDGDAGKDDRKINDLLKSFVKWCTAVGGGGSDGSEERALTYQRIILQLKNCEQSMMKSHQMLLMNRREMKNYEDLYAKIERGISDAQDKLNAAKAELATAKRIRRNRQEYDALARVIERHPSREETATKLARLESEIKQLQELKTDLNEKLEKRRKQFEILLGAAQDLHQIFKGNDQQVFQINGFL